jgi:hypothetical protein
MVFISGNFQGFTAHSLFLLLDILKFSAFLCFLAGLVCLVYLINGRKKKKLIPGPRHITFAAFCLIFGLAILFASQFTFVLTLPKF